MTSKSQSRGSSPKTSPRRPKLRSSATAPSLATSNASRNDLASLQSSRATTILTRVANYSTAQHEHAMRTSPSSVCSSPSQRSPESASPETRKEFFDKATHQSGNYFSFPSFEDFQFFEEDEENIDGRLDKGSEWKEMYDEFARSARLEKCLSSFGHAEAGSGTGEAADVGMWCEILDA